MEQSRRSFIQKAAMGVAGAASIPFINKAETYTNNFAVTKGDIMPVGIAGYTFNKFDLEKSIAMMKRIGVQNLSLKEFHLPINSNAEKVKSVMSQFAAANINVYAVGVIYMRTKQAVDEACYYA